MQLAKQQSEKLLKKGGSALDKYLNTNTKTGTDTTKTNTQNAQKEDVKKKAGDLINGLFKKKKPAEPATP
jgi:hypothetical protein